jgi:hypothetical protein
VYATGTHTEFGQVAHMTATVKREPSTLEVQINRVVHIITAIALSMGVLVFLLTSHLPCCSMVSLAIVRPLDCFPDIYDPAAVDAIIHLTGCHPFLLQLTCYELVQRLNRDIRENGRDASTLKATPQDVEIVIPAVLERGGDYFCELMRSFLPRHHDLMGRLAKGKTPTVQDKAVLRQLERRDILKNTTTGYSF